MFYHFAIFFASYCNLFNPLIFVYFINLQITENINTSMCKKENIIIRRAEAGDAGRIMDLLQQVLNIHREGRPDIFKESSGKYTVEELTGILADDMRPVFVATDTNGFVVGYCFCIFQEVSGNNILADMKTLYIDDLCIDKKCRGQRVGSKLYNHAVQFAKDSECYNLTLNVWACNTSAIKFYESLGLQPQKIGMEKVLL